MVIFNELVTIMVFNETKNIGDVISASDWNDFVDFTEAISGVAYWASGEIKPLSGAFWAHSGNADIHFPSSNLGSLAFKDSVDISDDTNLAVSYPITLTGDTIGINIASSTVSGALKASDWSTFNSKQNAFTHGTLSNGTGIQAFSVGISGSDATISVDFGTGDSQVASGSHLHDSRYYTKSQSDSNFYPSSLGHNHVADSTIHFTQSNITTVGTITTGVWHGSAIEQQYIASGTEYWNAYLSSQSLGEMAFKDSVDISDDTNLTTTYPITLTGDTIGINLASATVSGALKSADWTTFNNKQDSFTHGVLSAGTGIQSFSVGISGSDATVSVAFGNTSTTVASGSHLHDDRYYTESEIDAGISTGYVSSQTISGGTIKGTWQGNVISDAYIANDITLNNITQITNRSHTDLTDIGTNTHAQIDSHIADSTIHFTKTSLDDDYAPSGTLSWASIEDLSDVTTMTPSDGDVLTWNATLNKWSSQAGGSSPWSTRTGGIYYENEVTIGHENFDVGDYKLQVSGASYFSGECVFKGNTISGLTDPTFPSAAANKHYVDSMAYISSLNDVNLSQLGQGNVLTYMGATSKWKNTYPAMTFSIANVKISAQQNINLARFSLPGDKKCYVWQASACGSGGTSIADLKIQILSNGSVVYGTSSATVQQGNPLANPAGDIEIRLAYSGANASGYVYGTGFMNVSII